MIKAIIFDCFGVLAAASLEPFYHTYLHDDSVLVAQAAEADAKASRGLLTYKQLVQVLADLAKIDYELACKELDKNPPNLELLDYIRTRLKPRYRIGFLSNTSEDRTHSLFTLEQLELFDHITLSYRTGYAKPQPEIYIVGAENLGVKASECIFIDDRPSYCEGARIAGMHSIKFNDFQSFTVDLGLMIGGMGVDI